MWVSVLPVLHAPSVSTWKSPSHSVQVEAVHALQVLVGLPLSWSKREHAGNNENNRDDYKASI